MGIWRPAGCGGGPFGVSVVVLVVIFFNCVFFGRRVIGRMEVPGECGFRGGWRPGGAGRRDYDK